jgi:hypothetical protein
MAKSPSKKSKSPARGKSRSKSPVKKEKFFDLIQKKVFYSDKYDTVHRVMNSKNGKRKVTYHVCVNPTNKKDGTSFKNWKIVSNVAA